MSIGANIFGAAGIGAPPSTSSTASAATYGPATAPSSGRSPFSPRTGFGLGFTLSVVGVGALVLIRWSLPR